MLMMAQIELSWQHATMATHRLRTYTNLPA
jgi:hypothetical protein